MRELKHRHIITYTGLITVSTFITGLLNFVFNMVVGKLIGPAEYGILSPVMGSLFPILSLPVTGLQFFMNQVLGEISENHPEGLRSFIRFLFLNLCKLLFFVEVILWLGIPLFQRWFQISESTILMILFISVLVNYFQVFAYTLLQFHHAFGVIFWVTIGTTVLKLFMGVMLAMKGDATRVMFAYLVPLVVSTGIYALFLWKWYCELPKEGFKKLPHFWRSFVVSMVSGGAYMVLSSFDVLLVRVFFSDSVVVGTYAMAGLIARASFFIASAFTTVFLPVMSRQKERVYTLTFFGVGFLFVLLLGYTIGVWIFRDFIASMILKNVYPHLELYLPLYTFWFIPYAVISFLVSLYTVRKSLFYSGSIFGGVLVQLGLFFLWHENVFQALMIVGGVGYGLLGIFFVEMIWQYRRRV